MQTPTEMSPQEVRAFRELLGLSQDALGQALGGSKRAVEDWEAGRRRPPAMLGLAMAAIYQRLPPTAPGIAALNSAKLSFESSVTALVAGASRVTSQMSDDERFEWAQQVNVDALSCQAAMSNYYLAQNWN